ncbi:hypothetical protein BV924_21395 [Pectobacterium odoriferum]|uniref:Uncharacterized protein n=1 Tax=Pectobacterium odoriferum TaxID=78398 RepID=A0ABD6VJ57_9GAMM|nr:hypothetical protein [Pectobacterium odoriferum]POD91431.1 hypothetical protein BVY06_21745 [Pectobacterium odoriferum]POE08516.1 hypothetical protein BV924_21395 [Pectobacterium odoriferum]POE22889.1 hypothetical protein BV926_21460 [Pectobacterium odoriferum]POE27392.1 hypothetical protein BV919_21110 [Pectobacterium odoriferum]POE36811.1 hypothetical protein BV920_21520 [Pectobacterium odoriferum]
MRKLLFIPLFFSSFMAAAAFIHPMDFDNSEAQKNEVIEFIKETVKQDYCESGFDMCQESMLRMMEKENLNAFKLATKAKDRKIMDKVIEDYCESGFDMCNYSNIYMMYKENLKASKQSLEW